MVDVFFSRVRSVGFAFLQFDDFLCLFFGFLVGCGVYGFVFGSGQVDLDLCCFVGPDLWIVVLRGVLMLFGFVFGEFFMGSFCFSAFLESFGWICGILFCGFLISPLFVCFYVGWLMDMHLLLRILYWVYLLFMIDEYALLG